jgi:hypothetical protein
MRAMDIELDPSHGITGFPLGMPADDLKTAAAEVWIPRPGPEDITVRFRGIDVFRTPARELLGRLAAMGLTVLDETL